MPRYQPSATPTPSDDVYAYERGTQAVLINAASATVTQTGTAKPASADAIGLQACLSRGVQPPNAMVQVDIAGTGSWTTFTVNILGSLDGIKYYVLATIAGAAGGIFPLAGVAQARYISASVTTATAASGVPTGTVSICL